MVPLERPGRTSPYPVELAKEANIMTLAEMLDKLERGKIGHGEAMRWLGTDSINELVATVHANGRQMPGHRMHPISGGNAGDPADGDAEAATSDGIGGMPPS